MLGDEWHLRSRACANAPLLQSLGLRIMAVSMRTTLTKAAVGLTFVVTAVGLCASEREDLERTEKLPWSFAPLVSAETLPVVKNTTWPKSRIDYFILAKIESEGLNPAAAADGRTLLRRLHFDLIGLPPTMAETDEFCDCEDGIAEKVDELLSSEHYGERWARHWLDLARYTDVTASWLNSTGSAWRYRDWVVKSFNDDLAYPEFIKRQLAADLMPEVAPEENAALGFLGLSPTYWKELKLPPEIIKTTVADEWEERVDTLGRTFLGLTVACARCHDHKSDPISAADYYALAGVFASVRLTDRPMMSEELWLPVKAAREQVAAIEKKQVALKRTKPKPGDLDAQLDKLTEQIAKIKKDTPHYDMPTISGVADSALRVMPATGGHGTLLDYQDGAARNLELHKRGNPNDVGEVVPRRFLAAFPSQEAGNMPRKFTKGSGRLELAEAMIEDAQPLVARVIVNRIWRHHFGRGLVETPSDFGFTGDKPSHPQLLDDLAARFVDNGWSLKWLHREILSSATWQQSSMAPAAAEAFDPANSSYARMNRRRLDFEAWRDATLFVTGVLDAEIGGAPAELVAEDNVRRTLYGKIHRRDLDQMLRLHDFPDPAAHSPKRSQTTTPLQLLFTLNGPFIQKQAIALAKSLPADASTAERISSAYRRVFQRVPTEHEIELGDTFITQHKDAEMAWTEYAHVLLGSNELLFID